MEVILGFASGLLLGFALGAILSAKAAKKLRTLYVNLVCKVTTIRGKEKEEIQSIIDEIEKEFDKIQSEI